MPSASSGRRIIASAVVSTLLLCSNLRPVDAQTPQFRAFWAAAWNEGFKSPAEIDSLVSRAVAGRYNAIIAEVMAMQDTGIGGHGAYWNSSIVPKASDIVGDIDPLASLCQQAHAAGIEVHAWLVPFRVSKVWPPSGNAILLAHPEYFMSPRTAIGTIAKVGADYYMLDPGSPDVQEYLISIVRELVTNYALDGIHWDYIRFTQADAGYPSSTSYANSGLARFMRITGYPRTPPVSGYAPWDDFRRREVNELVRRARAEIPAITSNPRQPLRYTAALICGGSTTDFVGTSAYQVFQDWRSWMDAGWLDAGCPMNYREEYLSAEAQAYRTWVNAAIGWRYQRHMYCGQATSSNTMAGSVTQMQYAYDQGANGTVNFSYYATTDADMDGDTENDWAWYPYVAANLFTSTAPLPTMPWRNAATATEGTLFGRVTDAATGVPIDDATVQVGTLPAVKTDGNGCYTITLIPATGSGTGYTVTASRPGYTLVAHAGVQVIAGDVRRDDFAIPATGQQPPTITLQPQPTIVPAGGTATLTVAATGDGTLTWQWQKNVVDLTDGGHYSGTATPTLMVSNADNYDAAMYRCSVTNAAGTTWSNEALLTLENPGADFIVESRSGGKNNYTNYSEVGSLSNSANPATKSTAPGTTPNIGTRYASMSTQYSVNKAIYSFTPITTGLYEIFVTWPVSANASSRVEHIVTHAGGSVSLLMDQDRYTNPNGANNWNTLGQYNLVAGVAYGVTQTNENYSDSELFRADAVKWSLLVAAPAITEHPASQGVCYGHTAVFAVMAAGDGTLTYRWRKNGVDLTDAGHYSGVMTATLTVSDVDSGDAAEYCCAVTNAGGCTTSNTAALTLGVTPSDLDEDCDVDLSDFGFFQMCFAGPNRAITFNECARADLDADNDVDLTDFGTFQACFNGPNRPPACQ